MDEEYKKALCEVIEILKHSDKNIVKKIPLKFIEFLYKNKDIEYQAKIDFYDENWDKKIKEETKAILALIYRDYICSEEEREKLLIEENYEKIRLEEEKREKYNPDKIFKKKEIPAEIENNTQLAVIENYPWYKRIYQKILKIFGIK